MSKSKILANVKLGKNAKIGEYVLIGVAPKGKMEGELETVIGDNAVIRSHTVIYAGNNIGKNFQTGHHVTIRECNEIGDNVSIGTNSCIEHHISIEDGVRLHSQTFIPEFSKLEEKCWIGPNVILTNAKYPNSKNAKNNLQSPIIKEKAKIGANSTILPGKIVGKESLIGAGTVIVENVPDRKVVVGNPGKIIGDISKISEY